MTKFDYSKIPEHMIESITGYVDCGYELGGFLNAIFSNDLFNAVKKADDENLLLIPTYVFYISCKLPCDCYGSYEKVTAWKAAKRKNKYGVRWKRIS